MSRRARNPPAADAAPTGENKATTAGVRALVLHDSVYGRCGQVKEFPADEVEALRLAGYVDPHPNAVASAGG